MAGDGMEKVKFVAEISSVREVALLGTADLAFWNERLAAERLCPSEAEGKARVMIGATDARFKGIRFRELTISVFCRLQNGDQREGVYLAHAFNSVRWFAWVERTLFSTPYDYGVIDVDVGLPALVQLTLDNTVILRFQMSIDSTSPGRESVRCGEDSWAGPVFLPCGKRIGPKEGKWFLAKTGGQAQTYPFDPARDLVTLFPVTNQPVVQWLNDSKFSPKEWVVREAARHAKSKTYRRSQSFAD